jgi:hypothetical protein
MKKFEFFITIAFLMFYSISCNGSNNTTSKLYREATQNSDIGKFLKFIELLNNFEEKQRHDFLMDQENLEGILDFERIVFNSSSKDSVFILHEQIGRLLSDNAEYSEILYEEFSKYFIKDIKSSLESFERLKDQKAQEIIIDSVVFYEGSADSIINYIEQNNLSEIYKSSYDLFLPYKTN